MIESRWIRHGLFAVVAVLALLLAGACDNGGGGEEDEDVADEGEEDAPTDPDQRDDGPVDDVPSEDPVPDDPAPDDVVPDDVVPDDGVPDDGPPDAEEPEEDAVDVPEEDGVLPVNCAAIDESILADGLQTHLNELFAVATAGGGDRAASTAGWDGSVDYAQGFLEAAGYTVTTTTFDFPYFERHSNPTLERTAPTAYTYTYCTDDMAPTGDFQSVNLSPPGNVTANAAAVDVVLGPGNTNTSGCEAADFTGFTTGAIALLQRGTCPFQAKVANAQAAGAAGAILFNQGNTPAREGLMTGGVQISPPDPTNPDHGITIPVLFATYTAGAELVNLITSGNTVTLHMVVDTTFDIRDSQNLMVETATGSADEVVIFGAHMDTVLDTAGINDNGTGVAAVLEIARAVSECTVTRKIRFALWGGEEWGDPWGSDAYVLELPAADLARIYAYFNADMIGSPNYAVFAYDGDGSTFGGYVAPGVPGERSAGIERWFQSDLLLQGLATLPVYTEASDHYGFLYSDIACGGLFTGADGLKTAEEVTYFGGTVDAEYDACWHHDCDNLGNVDIDIAETLAKSLARAAQFFGVDGLDVPPIM